ncbi:transcriptional regulator [Pararhodospirillum photometricum]
MFADNTLTPREAVRLCALGTIARGPRRYSDLAASVRHFVTRITGPSLDLLGSSMELLRHEGLVEPLSGEGMEDDAVLGITQGGRAEFLRLMTANLRASSDLSRLVTALKFRFLDLLPADRQAMQAELLLETAETELARLQDLRTASADEGPLMQEWLEQEIAQAEERRAWLEAFADRAAAAAWRATPHWLHSERGGPAGRLFCVESGGGPLFANHCLKEGQG